MIKGIHHVALAVADYDKAYRFYTEGLGLSLYATWGTPEKTIALLDTGNGSYIELFSNGTAEEEANNRYTHLALAVDDVDAAFEKALSLGAKPHIYPKVVETHSTSNSVIINCAFVIGPGGEQLEFFRFL